MAEVRPPVLVSSLTPERVARAEFSNSFRGLDPTEVRSFLARVAGELRALHEREAELSAAVAELERRRPPAVHTLDEQQVNELVGAETARVLDAARQAAAAIRANAEEQAEALLDEARAEADELRARAGAVLAERTDAAEEEATRILSAAEAEAARLRDETATEAARVREEAETEVTRWREEAAAETSQLREETAAEAARLRADADADTARLREDTAIEAARVREEAAAEAANLRESAATDSARLRSEAELVHRQATEDATEQLERAREDGRRMIAEARAVRERILTDMARRRNQARQQLEKLRAGRERLLDAVEAVRRAVDEASGELNGSLVEARLAGERAARQIDVDAVPTISELDAEVDLAKDAGLIDLEAVEREVAGIPIGATLDERDGEGDDSYEGDDRGEGTRDDGALGLVDEAPSEAPVDEVADDEAELVEVGDNEAEVVEAVEADEADEVADVVEPADVGVAAGPGDAADVDVADVDAAGVGAEVTDIDADGAEAEADEAAEAADVADAAAVDVTGAEVADALAGEVGDGPSEPDGVDKAARPGRRRFGHAVDDVFTRWRQDADEVDDAAGAEPATARAAAGSSTVTPARPAGTTSLPGASGRAKGRKAAAPTKSSNRRGKRAAAAEPPSVTQVAATAPEAAEGAPASGRDATGRSPSPEPGAPPSPEPGADVDAEARTADQVGLHTRDAQLAGICRDLTRQLKLALSDEQNLVLERVRGGRPGRAARSDALPDAEELAAPYRQLARRELLPALEAGWRSVARAVAPDPAGPRAAPDERLLDPVVDDLVGGLTGPLRERLTAALGEGEDAAERVRNLYREFRNQRVGELAEYAGLSAFAVGQLAAIGAVATGARVRWVFEDCTPDCFDNSLAGDVPAGSAFPTGHTHPPAFVGCRCLLAAVVEHAPSDPAEGGAARSHISVTPV